MKRSREDEIGTICLKIDNYDTFYPILAFDHSQIILLYTSYIAQVYFTINLFTKHVIFKNWMYNWRIVLANLDQGVSKEKCRTNRVIEEM